MKKNLFLIAVATAVVAACSSDVEETIVAESCPVRLCTEELTGMTRAGQSVQLTQFDNGQQVGIFLAEDNGSGTAVTTGTNVTAYDQPLTYVSNGSGGLTNTQYWPQDGNGLHIFGVYPLAAATTAASYSATGVSFSVQADQSTDANYMLSDLMTGLPTDGNPVVRTTSAVPLTFTHLLTKINVNLTAGDGFTQAEIDDAVVSILGTKLTTTFDVQGKTVGSASGDATAIAAGTGAATSAIIVPQTLAAGASFIQVAVGGGNYIYKLDAATTFAAKNRYTFNLTVNKTGLVLTVTNITPWTAVDPIVGTAELLIPEPIDLSMVDCAGTPRTNRETANCYMVHTADKYLIPLVYGNAIKNGAVNTVAFNPGGTTTDTYCANFINHAGNPITAPWITKSTSGEGVDKGMGITVTSAELLWQDAQGLITEVGIDGDFLKLTVGKDATTQEGNAVIAVKDGSGNIVWSWHIWVTKQNFAASTLSTINTGSHTYQVTPVNIGWVGEVANYGYNPYYQWGRKDAFIPGSETGDWSSCPNHTVYDINNTEVTGFTYTESTTATIADNILQPTYFYKNPINERPYNTIYYNMWDAQQTSNTSIATATVKTVYDPCPPGFCVPTSNLCEYIYDDYCQRYEESFYPIIVSNRYIGGYLTTGSSPIYFPYSGFRLNSGSIACMWYGGEVWSASLSEDGGYSLSYGGATDDIGIYESPWFNGDAIRAVAEE